jgi:hypothetical protein
MGGALGLQDMQYTILIAAAFILATIAVATLSPFDNLPSRAPQQEATVTPPAESPPGAVESHGESTGEDPADDDSHSDESDGDEAYNDESSDEESSGENYSSEGESGDSETYDGESSSEVSEEEGIGVSSGEE